MFSPINRNKRNRRSKSRSPQRNLFSPVDRKPRGRSRSRSKSPHSRDRRRSYSPVEIIPGIGSPTRNYHLSGTQHRGRGRGDVYFRGFNNRPPRSNYSNHTNAYRGHSDRGLPQRPPRGRWHRGFRAHEMDPKMVEELRRKEEAAERNLLSMADD